MHLDEITIIYGLTEASPGITQTRRDDTLERRTQTVGQVLPEMELRIVDPVNGATLGTLQPGELWGARIQRHARLLQQSGSDCGCDRFRWLATNRDEATIDDQGYVRITGRIKDIIIRGGENISPKEIEDLLRQHPDVADAYVYGVRSEFFGEEVAAAVRLKAGANPGVEDLRQFCVGKVARFKIPKLIRFVTEFPMTASARFRSSSCVKSTNQRCSLASGIEMKREDFVYWMEVDVRWGDMDSQRHVNNAVYLPIANLLEWSFSASLASVGKAGADSAPALVSTTCNFRKQVTYPSKLDVGVSVVRIGNRSFTMNYGLFLHETDELVADASSVNAWIDYDEGKSVQLSDEMKAALAQYSVNENRD
jgi:acyl-CoA thioesterase FadM